MPRAKAKTLFIEMPTTEAPASDQKAKRGTKQMLIPIAYRPADAAHVLGVSRSTVYRMITEGELEARHLGGATLIAHEELMRVFKAAPLTPHTKFAHDRAGRL